MPQLLIPALAKEIESYGGPAPALELEQAAMPVVGETCWQIRGELPGDRRFWLCFTKDDIQAPRRLRSLKRVPHQACWSRF